VQKIIPESTNPPKAKQVIGISNVSLQRWINDNQILLVSDQSQIALFHLDTSAIRNVYKFFGKDPVVRDISKSASDKVILAVERFRQDDRFVDLFKLEISSGKVDILRANSGFISQWLIDSNLNIIGTMSEDETGASVLHMDDKTISFPSRSFVTSFTESTVDVYYDNMIRQYSLSTASEIRKWNLKNPAKRLLCCKETDPDDELVPVGPRRFESKHGTVYTIEMVNVHLKINSSEIASLSVSDLSKFDGVQSPKIFISIEGTVFDVSSSKGAYGPGGTYSCFAGKEVAVALARMSFNSDDIGRPSNSIQMTPAEKLALDEWASYFKNNYRIVGNLLNK